MLTVGTDAFDTLANVDAYHADRGNADWAAVVDDTQREIFIRKGTDWINRTFDALEDPTTETQRLKWPTFPDTTIPWQVAEATAIIADLYRLGVYDLEGILTSDDASINRTKVDVIEVGYDTSKRLLAGSIPTHVYQLLRPLTGQGRLRRA